MKRYRIEPGSKVRLKDHDPADHHHCRDKAEALKLTAPLHAKLEKLQERLYAENRRALLLVLQGMDTAGKDGTIRHVMGGVNPQGCQVTSFKQPSVEERDHDFLWRIHKAVPRKGHLGIFNRSHYEDVLVTRVHGIIDDDEAERRFRSIVEFEKALVRGGVAVVKCYLHISKDEQRDRLRARLEDPKKHWKFSAADLAERKYWKDYRKVYEDALAATSTEKAPWHVVPADHKWYRDWVVTKLVVDALEDMDPRFPDPDPSLNFSAITID